MVGRSRIFGFGAVVATLVVVGCSSSSSPATKQSAPAAGPSAPTAVIVAPTTAPTNPPPPAAAAVATATVVPKPLWVGNTDGQGVFLRRTPQLGDKMAAYVDGTLLRVVGPEVDGDGTHWQHVVAPDGKEGFVPSSFALTTQVPTPTPVVATATSVPATPKATALPTTRTPVPAATARPTARSNSALLPPIGASSGGCGSRGGPGYRKANGQCASWRDAGRR